MNIKLQAPNLMHLQPRITVVGVGGAGSNAVNNMIASGLSGVNFVVANTDSQSLANSSAEHRIQLGAALTEGLGAGARPEIGKAAAEEAVEEIRSHVARSHMVFVAAGMGGGTGTGAAAIIARVAREAGALTVGIVTKPFQFEGSRRMRASELGIAALRPEVDTLIVIPNQNLFRVANERTTFAEAFVMADQVLYSGIACVVDLIVKEGLINLDFADVRTVMSGMGTAMMGTGEAAGERRATAAAEEAISNPLLDDISLRGAKGLLVSITGGRDLTLYEVDEAATRVRQEVDPEANIIVGATFDDTLGDKVRVSIVASGMERLSTAGHAFQADAAATGWNGATTAEPAAIDTQPPFMEPYSAPYGNPLEPAPVAPANPMPPSYAPQVQQQQAQHQEAAPLSSLRDTGLRDAGGARSLPVETDLTRALSEALGHRDPPAAQSWSSPSGAVFQEAAPQLAPWQPHGGQPHGGQQSGHQDHHGFTPQPPAETQGGPRRLPQVEDFPLIGQREYHAKSNQYGNPQPSAPRAYTQPAPEPAPKLGFFARLMRGRRSSVQNKADAAVYPQALSTAPAGRDQLHPPVRNTAAGADGAGLLNSAKPHELPVFFGSSKK